MGLRWQSQRALHAYQVPIAAIGTYMSDAYKIFTVSAYV